MNNTMEYKGYVGSVEFSENDNVLFGKVQGIRSLISYEGTTVSERLKKVRKEVKNNKYAMDAIDFIENRSKRGIGNAKNETH